MNIGKRRLRATMVTNVRINEVVASIAISSGGTGRSTVENVVKDLRRSIGASAEAVREAIARAAELQYIIKEGDVVRLDAAIKALMNDLHAQHRDQKRGKPLRLRRPDQSDSRKRNRPVRGGVREMPDFEEVEDGNLSGVPKIGRDVDGNGRRIPGAFDSGYRR